jgi:hypothetical protein
MTEQTPLDPGRRDALRKLLAGATVATAAPVVSTFFAPAGAALTSSAINRFLLVRNGSGDNALTTGAMTAQNTDATGQGCVPVNWSTGANTLASDGITGSVTTFFTDRNGNGVFNPAEANVHITDAASANGAGNTTQNQNITRSSRVTFSVTLPAGCRFDTTTGFPTAATARVRATILRNFRGPDAVLDLDGINGDNPGTGVGQYEQPQCVDGVISGISADGRTATITAVFTERKVYDDDLSNDDWATYKVNNVELRIAAYCNL